MKGYLIIEQWVNEPFNEFSYHGVYLKKSDAYKKVENLINQYSEDGYCVYCKFEDIDQDDDADGKNDVYIWVEEVNIIE